MASLPDYAGKHRPKTSIRLVRLFGVSMLVIMAWTGSGVVAQTTKPLRRVLVLYSDERLLPANIITDEAIRATFAFESNNPLSSTANFSTCPGFPESRRSSMSAISYARSIGIGHPTW